MQENREGPGNGFFKGERYPWRRLYHGWMAGGGHIKKVAVFGA